MSELENKIKEDLKASLKERDELRSSVLRLLLSDIKNASIEKRAELSDEEIIEVISRSVKKRKDSIESYKRGGREDLVKKEEDELKILQVYLPEQMSEEEIEKLVEETISEVGASSPAEFGKVMEKVMGKAKGKAEGKTASRIVKEKLS
jgi:hypothetical protein